MQINISNLSEGIHHYELSKNAQKMGLQNNFLGDVTARVTLERSSRQYILQIETGAKTQFQCDRCTDDFVRQLNVSFHTVYSWDSNEATEDEEDFHLLEPSANIIDISDDVREYLLLSIPQKMLCKDDCAGICPSCGKNLNQGSCTCPDTAGSLQWNALQNLLGHTPEHQ